MVFLNGEQKCLGLMGTSDRAARDEILASGSEAAPTFLPPLSLSLANFYFLRRQPVVLLW